MGILPDICPSKNHLFRLMKGIALSNCSKHIVILFLLVVAPAFSIFAQAPPAVAQTWEFVFGGRVTEFDDVKQKDNPLEGCTVTMTGPKGDQVTTSGNGKFKLHVPANGDYVVTVTKPGYITKKFEINTFNVPDKRAENPFAEFDVDIDLFKIFPGLDYSVLNNPIARIIYNPAPDVDDMDYDKVYTAQIQAQLDKLKELAKEAREKLRQFQALITEADKLFGSSDYTNAKEKYQEALAILPNEQYPKDQIAKCDQKLGETAAQQKQYNDLIAAADAAFTAKDYAGAKDKYQQAQTMRPAETYPPARIKACDDAIAAAGKDKAYNDAIAAADTKFNAKDFAGAKALYQNAQSLKPAEPYPPQRIKACDDGIAGAAKDKAYQDAIAAADAKFNAKDFAGAKPLYQNASTMKPAEQYPIDQMKKCDDGIAAAGKDKAYQDAITAADAKFTAKDFAGAKTGYQGASSIKPTEQYPIDQMKKCDDAIAAAGKDKAYQDAITAADAKFTAKDFSGAKALYQNATSIKPAEQYPIDQAKKCDDAIAAAGKDKAYQDAITAADAKFTAKDFAGAKTLYQNATSIKPTEQYPIDQAKKCDDAIAAAGKDKAYQDAITAADTKFTAKDFSGAKTLYQNATSIKPAEQYPIDQAKKCDDAIAVEGKEKQYADLIKNADTKFTAKDFAGAKTIYQQASDLKTSEQYPKDQMKKCNDGLAAADLDKKYNDLIKQADAKFTAKTFADAKTLYQQASDLKTSEQYPKDQMKKCDDALGVAAIDAQYKDLITQADTKFTAKDYAGAKDLYTQAGNVKPKEIYPPAQIKKCDDAVAADTKNKAYNDLITSADAKFAASDWSGAKDIYQQASTMKPTEQYPKDKMKACDDKINGAAKDKQYADAIADADTKFNAKDYTNAKTAYQNASTIKPTEQYPKDQMKKCDDALNAAAKDQQYSDAIADADKKFDAKDFAGARSQYAVASGLKPTEQYPKDRMKACDDQMGAAAKEKAYTDAIAAADTKFGAKDFAGAKAKYTEASGLKPTEQYPIDQIKKCDDALAAADADKKYNDLIKQADAKFALKTYADAKTIYQQASDMKTAEQYPKDQIKKCDDALGAVAIDKQYNDLIKQADTKFTAKDYAGAKDLYTQAGNVKPAETYPPQKIKACDDAMGSAAIDAQYKDLITQADTKFTAKDYAGAKDLYTQAGNVKPKEIYPPAQIKKCDDAVAADTKNKAYNDLITSADAKFAASDWSGAKDIYQQASTMKPTEQYPKDKMKACDDKINGAAKDKQYADAIADADKKFDAKDFTGARSQYAVASGLKPTEQYPKDRMKACDDQMGAAAKEKAYTDAIAAADAKFDAKDWVDAKAKYTEASGLKPAEQYPKDRMKACDDNLAAADLDKKYTTLIAQADAKFTAKDWAGAKTIYQQASTVKASEQYPKDQIKLCDDNAAGEKDQKYKDAIAQADTKFAAKDFSGAKVLYQTASGLKPTEQYPIDQMKKCDDGIAASGIDKKYNDLIKQADAAFDAKTWASAKTFYQQASAVKPDEQYPKDRMKACDDNIASAGVDKQYNDLIKQADLKFTAKAWAAAKDLYSQASGVKPAEQYPKDRMKACDDNLNSAKDKAYNDIIASADAKFKASDWSGAKTIYQQASTMRPDEQYPKDQMKACDDNLAAAGVDKQYQTIIAAADAKFTAKDWAGAKAKYQEASGVKANESYPKDQIKKCDDNLDALMSIDAKYQKDIARGDSAMTSDDLETAQSSFEDAKKLKPSEPYPPKKLAEIAGLIAAQQKDKAYRALLASGDSLINVKDYVNAKKTFTTATLQRPDDQYPKDKLAAIKFIMDNQQVEAQKQKNYDLLMSQADKKFAAKDWAGAKALYNKALLEKPLELLPKTQIQKCDNALNPKAVVHVDSSAIKTKDQYVSDLVSKYPPGVSTSTTQDGGNTIETRVVIVGNKGWVYTKKTYSWGVFYFKDDVQISENTFNYETSPNYVKSEQADYDKAHQ